MNPTYRLRIDRRLRRPAIALLGAWVAACLPPSANAQTRFSFETDSNGVAFSLIVFAPDNRLLALAANGADILLFDLAEQREVAVLKHAPGLRSLVSMHHIEFAPDGRTLAVMFDGDERDREIVFFDVEKRASRGSIPLGKAACTRGAFSPDGSRFAARVGQPGRKRRSELRVWESASLRMIKALDSAPFGVNHNGNVAFSPDGKWLATVHNLSDTKGQVFLFDATTFERRFTLRAAGGWLQLAFSTDSQLLAAGITHHKGIEKAIAGVHLWDVQTGKQRGWLDGYHGAPQPHAWAIPVFAPDGMLLAATCGSRPPGDMQVKLWNIATGDIRVLDRDRIGFWSGWTPTAVFSRDGGLFASAAQFGQMRQFGVRLWETKYWRRVALLDMSSGLDATPPLAGNERPEASVDTIQFSPDGKWLAARRGRISSRKHDIFLWKLSEVLPTPQKSTGY